MVILCDRMGEQLTEPNDKLSLAPSETPESIDLREPVGLHWYETEYKDDIELFGQNVALGLVFAARELEKTFTLGPKNESKLHGQSVRLFIGDTVRKLMAEEERPAPYTSLFNAFNHAMGFSSTDLLTDKFGSLLEQLDWYEEHADELTSEQRMKFQELPDWQDNVFTVLHAATKRLDQGLSRTDLTYQGATMDDWDGEAFVGFLTRIAETIKDNPSYEPHMSGFSWQVSEHLLFEVRHRFKIDANQGAKETALTST
jgi:hypothetical protein